MGSLDVPTVPRVPWLSDARILAIRRTARDDAGDVCTVPAVVHQRPRPALGGRTTGRTRRGGLRRVVGINEKAEVAVQLAGQAVRRVLSPTRCGEFQL